MYLSHKAAVSSSFSEHVYSNVAIHLLDTYEAGTANPNSHSILSGFENLERASQVKVETVRAFHVSINSLAVLLDNINIIFG